MKKKLLIGLLLIFPCCVYAEDSPFPTTTRGIQILPMAKHRMPEQFKKEIMAKKAEEEIKGYRTRNDENARFLLSINRYAESEIKENKISKYGKYDTHLKRNYSEIKLSFPFTGVAGIEDKNIIGYAAMGSYLTKEKEGWNGITVFFNSSNMGTCAYSFAHILAVQLAEETTEYLVNKKPSDKIIEGNYNTGFVYTIEWYTNNSISILECANMKLDKDIMTKMIVLANKIDRI